MPRILSGKEQHLYRVVVHQPVYDTGFTHPHFYGPYTEHGPAVAQGRRRCSRSGGWRKPRVPIPGATYQVQRITIGDWETQKPATWEPVRG